MAETVMLLASDIIKAERRTCVMITHNMEHAIKYGDRLVVLKDGNIVKEYVGLAKHELTPAVLF